MLEMARDIAGATGMEPWASPSRLACDVWGSSLQRRAARRAMANQTLSHQRNWAKVVAAAAAA
eukprot:CAMPEP_0172701366 /NCGR_PEP_ID=MMETSP1074-20121228/31589_1 /TAXON_ID=2916 /ORGANISM="Ceratium fusus, Strain PA161109" /LENGTH=62 /DNA_ID=CAMNT_0013522907 /DNA_START=292 /DNA_END=478 /DNA_ORIENTATION=-